MEENQTLTEIDKETSDLYGKTPSEITAARGRLIRKIKKEIKRIKEKEELSEEETKAIEELEERLNNLLLDHKAQLSDRYKKEFIDERADFSSLVTVLPVGVGISIKKVEACINELKQAKTTKSKLFKSIELLKALGLVAATPVIYSAKFIVNHWYLVLLVIALLKLPIKDIFKKNTKDQKETEQIIDNNEEEIITQPEQNPETEKPANNDLPENKETTKQETTNAMQGDPRFVAPKTPKNNDIPEVKEQTNPVEQTPQETIVEETPVEEQTNPVEQTPQETIVEETPVEEQTNPVEETPQETIVEETPMEEQFIPEEEPEWMSEWWAEDVVGFYRSLRSHNYPFIIKDQCPDTVFVHNSQEMLEYIQQNRPDLLEITADPFELYNLVFDSEKLPVYWYGRSEEFIVFETTPDFLSYIYTEGYEQLGELFDNFVDGIEIGDYSSSIGSK